MCSTVVVVEDEELIAFFIRETLELEGYDVVCFAQGKEAWQYLQGNATACIIIDVGLPDIPGDELAREIRRSRPDLPIILATGYSASDLEVLFTGDTRLCVLPKPYNETRLMVELERLMGIRLKASANEARSDYRGPATQIRDRGGAHEGDALAHPAN